ncbi:MAG TPA: phenylalanine--tRNA ligase subunit beta [Nitrosopumilaceae archaeon]|nr:phenylalanine--tRNA ligase subunit beta [Nitrosopumilaceae archaeon]
MPVVTLYLDRLQRLVGKTNKEKIISTLPFLGLDIEEQTDEYVRVEYSPNRPDYATDFGIAAGLQGLLGIKKGLVKLEIKKGSYQLKADQSVKKVRPYVTAIVAKNGTLDDETIRQLITLQEDLHFGIGRNRKKSSIGIHDFDKIEFPLRYTTATKEHRFVPLGSESENSISEILENTEAGQQYGRLLENSEVVPVILDAKGNTISFPPIINSALTTVSTLTKNLLVEVTATDKNTAEDTLAVVATTLQNAGFLLTSVQISGAGNTTPSLKTKKMNISVELTNKTLGLKTSSSIISAALKKCRLDALPKKNNISCTIPRFRFDILGTMDLIEEVALGYGIENLKPTLPQSSAVGQKNIVTKQLDLLNKIMVGLGFTEVLNSSLVSKNIQYGMTNRDSFGFLQVVESKSQEHTILRDMLLPSMLDTLSRNVHEQYPQKLFEIGTVFSAEDPIKEELTVCCISTHKDANYSEIKSILQSALKTGFNIECQTSTSTHFCFAKGKTADVIASNFKVGVIGEIDSAIVENFKIRMPVVAFEIKLSGLIFN